MAGLRDNLHVCHEGAAEHSPSNALLHRMPQGQTPFACSLRHTAWRHQTWTWAKAYHDRSNLSVGGKVNSKTRGKSCSGHRGLTFACTWRYLVSTTTLGKSVRYWNSGSGALRSWSTGREDETLPERRPEGEGLPWVADISTHSVMVRTRIAVTFIARGMQKRPKVSSFISMLGWTCWQILIGQISRC